MAMIQMVTAAIYIVSPVNGALLCVCVLRCRLISFLRSHSVFLFFARKLMRIRVICVGV